MIWQPLFGVLASPGVCENMDSLGDGFRYVSIFCSSV